MTNILIILLIAVVSFWLVNLAKAKGLIFSWWEQPLGILGIILLGVHQ